MSDSRVIIKYFPTRPSADFAREELRAAGIESSLQGDDVGGWVPAVGFGTGGLGLLVAADKADEAKAILESLESGA